ncbi:MAG: HD-GYP domain-containing protein, partial [Actinomycetota bacterium]
MVRLAIFVVPFVTAMTVAFVLSGLVPLAGTTLGTLGRWVFIVAVATVAMRLADKLARRLLPLSTLLQLTLVFPDQAPSRFSMAMRTGTTKQLAKRIEAARVGHDDETPAEAAERLLELVGLLSHHDRLTRGHSERVRAYTHLLGSELGLTDAELDKIRWAGLLHDVGKTAIPGEILNKPGRLTDEEFDTIKTHPNEGKALVAPLAGWLGESLRAVWEHHERFDGRGYPNGLVGTDISMAARIVSVADTYDVMTSARSYKAPMPAAEARAELARCSGTQFDPVVVRAFLNISLGRLRLMAGPLAWLTQLALFEPTGVVHAGGSSGGASTGTAAASSGGTGSIGSLGGSVASGSVGGTASAAAATGGASIASVVSTTAAVTMGVASGAVGIAAAEPAEAVDDARLAVETTVDLPVSSLPIDPAEAVFALDADELRVVPSSDDVADAGVPDAGGAPTVDVFDELERLDRSSNTLGASDGEADDDDLVDDASDDGDRTSDDDRTDDEEPTRGDSAEPTTSVPATTPPGSSDGASAPPGQEVRESTPAATAPGQEVRESTPAAT